MCETKLHKNSTFQIQGYEAKKCNLKAGKEGMLIAVKQGTYNDIQMVYAAEAKNIMTVEITYPQDTIRVIVVHGPQEGDPVEDREEFTHNLSTEVERCVQNNIKSIILRDFNARLTVSVEGKIESVKGNGKPLSEVINKHELKVVNFDEKTQGEWTRIQKKGNEVVKSVIDYLIVDSSTHPLVKETHIDEDKLYTPYRIQSKRKKKEITFSDHCAITTTIIIKKGSGKTKGEKSKVWVLTEEGLKKFEEITAEDIGPMAMVDGDPYLRWTLKVEEIMHLCFKKKTISGRKQMKDKLHAEQSKVNKMKEILSKISQKGKIQRKIAKEYIKRIICIEARKIETNKAKNLKETILHLTENDALSSNAFWKLKKSASRSQRTNHMSVRVQSDSRITTKPTEVKDEVKKEFEYRLRNRKAEQDWEQYVKNTNEIVESLLADKNNTPGTPFTMEELKEAITKLKKGTSPGKDGMLVEIFIRAGKKMLEPLLEIFNMIKITKLIPEQWRDVLITMIYKNKGSQLDLVNFRGIFLTLVISKLFERILQERMKTNLKKVSMYQMGSRAGKSAADNLFLLRGCMDYYKYLKHPIYITTYDFEQAFDSLWLQDCILVLHRLGVEKYILELIYELNKSATVQVKTPYGLTTKS